MKLLSTMWSSLYCVSPPQDTLLVCNLIPWTTSKHVPFPFVPTKFRLNWHPSKMEALGGYRTKSSSRKERILKIFVSLAVCMGGLFLVQHKLIRTPKSKDFYSFDVMDAKGRTVSLEKYRGKVSKPWTVMIPNFPFLCIYMTEMTIDIVACLRFATSYILQTISAGLISCKRGEPLWADREELPSPARATPRARDVALQCFSVSLFSVREYRARDESWHRSMDQSNIRRHFPLFQQNQNNGIWGQPSFQIPHR